MGTKFAVETIFKAVDRISGPLTRMTSSVNRFANTAERSLGRVNKGLNRTSSAISSGIKATTAAAAVSGAALAKVTQTGAEFEQQITNAAAKFPGEIRRGTKAFGELSDAARLVGSATEFSASQAAGALNFLAMAGFDADQSIGALPKIVDFATAATLDLATASDIASDALGQFNLTSKDAEKQTANLSRIMDVMSKTATTASVTAEQLFETFKDAGPVAAAAGASIETVSALTGELANAGIKGSRAGTALRAVFGRLQAPVGKSAEVLKRLGIETRDSAGNMLDVVDILGTLDKSLTKFGTSEKAEILKTVFGEEPIAAVNVLLTAGAKKLNTYRGVLEKTAGSTKKLADVMRDTTQADTKAFNSAVEGLVINFFELNRKGIREAVQGATAWTRAASDATKANAGLANVITSENITSALKFGKVLLYVTGLLVALKVATLVVSGTIALVTIASTAATAAMWAWGASVAAMNFILATARAAVLALNIAMYANPVGLVVLAVVALTAAVAAAIIYWDELKAMFTRLPGPVKAAIAVITGPIGWLVGAAAIVMDNWAPISDFFSDLWSGITDTFDSAVAKISAAIVWAKQAAASVGLDFGGAVAQTPTPAATAGDGVASPQEAITRSINENRSSAEVTLRNETGSTAEVASTYGNMRLNLMNSGGF